MTNEPPVWLARAWRVRAVLLVLVLGLVALALYGRSSGAEGGVWTRALPVLAVLVIGLALWADWLWLKRNHHRVNEWGLTKGKDARKKPGPGGGK